MNAITSTIHFAALSGKRSNINRGAAEFDSSVVNWIMCEGLKYRGEHGEHDHVNLFALCIAGFMFNKPIAP